MERVCLYCAFLMSTLRLSPPWSPREQLWFSLLDLHWRRCALTVRHLFGIVKNQPIGTDQLMEGFFTVQSPFRACLPIILYFTSPFWSSGTRLVLNRNRTLLPNQTRFKLVFACKRFYFVRVNLGEIWCWDEQWCQSFCYMNIEQLSSPVPPQGSNFAGNGCSDSPTFLASSLSVL